MARVDMDIKTLLDIAKWEPLQDALADALDITVIVLDYKGNAVTAFSHCADFCSQIRTNAVARRHCFKCAALAGLESVRHKEPFIYRCSCGIMNAAIPVMIDEKYLGSVMIGQARPTESKESFSERKLLDEVRSFYPADKELDSEELIKKYYLLPEMSYDKMLQISIFVISLIQYIIGRVLQNRNQAQTYEWMLRYAVPSMLGDDMPPVSEIKPVGIDTVQIADDLPVPPESAVYPAINYVETHRSRMIGMREMAELCHLSPSYFSKLFLREVGENFTDWVNRRKLEWAKEMLRDSSNSITDIASGLGYMDTSYFIKVFKKFEGTTPLAYRQRRL